MGLQGRSFSPFCPVIVMCGRGMFWDWDLDLWAAKSTGWAFCAEFPASGTRGTLGKDLQLGKGR